jgi:hypothetical protein
MLPTDQKPVMAKLDASSVSTLSLASLAPRRSLTRLTLTGLPDPTISVDLAVSHSPHLVSDLAYLLKAALNTLANHGYIPRNGSATVEEIHRGVMEGFNVEHDFAAFVVSFATVSTLWFVPSSITRD